MNSILQEVTAINKMSMVMLRQKYKELFNEEAPVTANRLQLIPKMAYQVQVLALGGLNRKTIQAMEDLNRGKIPVYAQSKTKLSLPAGTIIIKEYHGETYKIKVTDSDFIMNELHYPSLSKVAKAITGGTNWNIKRFFKLEEAA